MVDVPEIWGHIFVGRTKEGFSLNKVMVGYAGWTTERATINDATIPILADGIKWLGYCPEGQLLWNLGVYGDWLSEGQTFSTYDNQYVGRLAWLPMISPEGGSAAAPRHQRAVRQARRGQAAASGASRSPSQPRTSSTPASSPPTSTTMTGIEVYYRPGPLLVGSEYFFQNVDAPEFGQSVLPRRRGGRDLAGHRRDARLQHARRLLQPDLAGAAGVPGRPRRVGIRGPLLVHRSRQPGSIRGGRFWRFTPMVNWHLSDQLRLEVAYGYGSLDRFDAVGRDAFLPDRACSCSSEPDDHPCLPRLSRWGRRSGCSATA